mgnify:CR=1 FL=1
MFRGGVYIKYYNHERDILIGLYWSIIHIAGFQIESDVSKADFISKKKQRKIRLEINMFVNTNNHALSNNHKEQLSSQNKIRDIFSFLKSQKEDAEEAEEARRKDWLDFASELNEEVKDALEKIFDDEIYSMGFNDLQLVDGKVEWSFEASTAFKQVFHLTDPVFSENYSPDSTHSVPEISKTKNGYLIKFIQSDFDESDMSYTNEQVCSLTFSDMKLDITCYNYTKFSGFSYEPWEAIHSFLHAMDYKHTALGEAFLNDKEKALLPLYDFSPLNSLSGWHTDSACGGNLDAARLFISLAKEADNQKVVRLSQEYLEYAKEHKTNMGIDISAESQSKHKSPKKLQRLCQKIVAELKRVESEPLYRLFLEKIKDAACEYSAEIEHNLSASELNTTRALISEKMHENGFEGVYPHFKKLSPLKGIKLLEINGQPVIIFHEKNTVSCIDCLENFYGDQLIVSYAVSTIFLKKHQLDLYQSLDGDSGFFIEGNRRRARYIMFNNFFNDLPSFDLQKSIDVAIKTSQCEKLTKDERKEYAAVGPGKFGVLILAIACLFGGILFGLLMSIAMFLLGLILGVPLSGFSTEITTQAFIHDLVFDFPWYKMFLFCSLSFGSLMFLFMIITIKKGR